MIDSIYMADNEIVIFAKARLPYITDPEEKRFYESIIYRLGNSESLQTTLHIKPAITFVKDFYKTIPVPPDYTSSADFIPAACRGCGNHPSNGGDGICSCILATAPIT